PGCQTASSLPRRPCRSQADSEREILPDMAQRTVNARQLRVLQWIVAGCPDGDVARDPTSKTTAVALRNRRLATISRRGGVWTAAPTDAGTHFAEHGAYPEGHWLAASEGAAELPLAPRTRRNRPEDPGLRPVDQMIAEVAAAGG